MKGFLLLLLVLVTLHSAAQSRVSDSSTVSNEALRRVYAAALQKKVLEEQVFILNQRIDGLELVIKEYQDMDVATRANYDKEIAVMKDQRGILEGEISRVNKEVKKWKRKLFWRTAAGIAAVAGVTFLYITK